MKPSSELGTSNQQPATSTFSPKKLPWLEAHVVALARYRPGPKGVQRDEGRVNGCSSTMDYLIPPKILRPFGKNSKHNGVLNACPGASIFEAVNWWVVHSRGPQNDDPPICPWRKANFFADHQPHQPPCGQPRKKWFHLSWSQVGPLSYKLAYQRNSSKCSPTWLFSWGGLTLGHTMIPTLAPRTSSFISAQWTTHVLGSSSVNLEL